MAGLIKYPDIKIWLFLAIFYFTKCESDLPSEIIDYTGQIGTVIDIDSNIYQTVGIGAQIWMAENLATSRLNNGTEISTILNDSIWIKYLHPAYCTYKNDTLNYKKLFGLLYNFYAVKTEMICPIGWRVPSFNDWIELAEFAGGLNKAGGKLKQMNSTLWEDSNYGFDKTYNFNALPGGYRRMELSVSRFYDLGYTGYWWTADSVDFKYSLGVYITNTGITLSNKDFKQRSALSIRCIKN